ncbi:RhoGAP-domain-containing protein [Rhizodiscina lignyota]|uniref:RhoGAP-domain-containing protein n=1 Tax=Rhizodiscina lignyota TaxID=1504668 RepID=A0A9P4IRY8_9PEZI|nr:RhoGAP-domain-containing protein [Rhizodiscina lignyota]
MDDNQISPVHSNGNFEEKELLPSSPIEASKAPPVAPVDDGTAKAVDNVLYSDIGVNTLLVRLKQSIASARDFASFLKKRSSIEDEHAKELKKLCRVTHENVRRQESRQGSYAKQFDEVTNVHERMAENGAQFALSLHQMHEDLTELSQNMEKNRKHWKQTGLAAENRVQDAERQMEKAKAKYDSLAEDYDGVKTGDKKVRHFGLRGPKNEEDLQGRVQAADGDYQQKVQHARSQRQELVTTLRPQAVKAIQELITECDSALTLQLQKFATFNEKLLLSNGLLITPLGDPNSPEKTQRSLRDIVHQIDNERDLQTYIKGHASKVPSRSTEIKYEQHPGSAGPPQSAAPMSAAPMSAAPMSAAPMSADPNQPLQRQATDGSHYPTPSSAGGYQAFNGYQQSPHERGYGGPPPQHYPGPGGPQHQQYPGPGGPPPLQHQQQQIPSYPGGGPGPRPGSRDQAMRGGMNNGPPSKPIFGINLEELFMRDGTPVPKIVMDCLQAVDTFGLDMEGIYRVPGTAQQIQQLRAMYERDPEGVDFRNPETFFHDVNLVAGLLKQYFRELPEPLLTNENYGRFIEAARIQDPIVRRDSIHAAINELPDPNYATLRALVLHLQRVQSHEANNRMSSMNLAICFAPTIMGAHKGPMQDAGLQAQVVDTILLNTLQIFDED